MQKRTQRRQYQTAKHERLTPEYGQIQWGGSGGGGGGGGHARRPSRSGNHHPSVVVPPVVGPDRQKAPGTGDDQFQGPSTQSANDQLAGLMGHEIDPDMLGNAAMNEMLGLTPGGMPGGTALA